MTCFIMKATYNLHWYNSSYKYSNLHFKMKTLAQRTEMTTLLGEGEVSVLPSWRDQKPRYTHTFSSGKVFFYCSFPTLSIALWSNDRNISEKWIGKELMETIFARPKVLSRDFPGVAEENHENSVRLAGFRTSRIRSRIANQSNVTFSGRGSRNPG
jgi:hypothetical protein